MRTSRPHHHLRIAAATLALSVLAMLGLLLVGTDAGATAPDPNLGHKVTLCHAEGNGSWHAVSPDVRAAGLQGGHDNESGIHVSDIIPPFSWIDNRGNLRTYPGRNLDTMFDGVSGSTILANGCAAPKQPEPVDVCPNIEGLQDTVPEGYIVNDAGACAPAGQETDVCPNLPGDQSVIPDGYVMSSRDCVLPPNLTDPIDPIDPGDVDTQAPTVPVDALPVATGAPGAQPGEPAGTPPPTDAQAPQGGDEPDGRDDPATSVTDVPTTRVVAHGNLPRTGTETRMVASLAVGLLALGLMLEFAPLRRRGGSWRTSGDDVLTDRRHDIRNRT